MKGFFGLVVTVLVLVFSVLTLAFSCPLELRKGLKEAMSELKLKRGDRNFAVLTNAGYVAPRGLDTRWAIDTIQEVTGASVGKGNLLFFHRPVDYPLVVAVMRREGETVCYCFNGEVMTKAKVQISPEKTLSVEGWSELQKTLGPDSFSLASIFLGWAVGAPWGLLKSAELHDHLCPGLISGYLLVNFIRERYPLEEGKTYLFIACPPWCKDDAIQVLLNLTPGKRSLYTMELTEAQKKSLMDPNVAGILVVCDRERKQGKAIVLRFDWQKAYDLTGWKSEGHPMVSRLKLSHGLIPYLGKPSEFVSVLKELDVDRGTLERLTQAGVHPYGDLKFVLGN